MLETKINNEQVREIQADKEQFNPQTTHFMYRGPGFELWSQKGSSTQIGTANQDSLVRDAETFIEASNSPRFSLRSLGYSEGLAAWQFSDTGNGIFHLIMTFMKHGYRVDKDEQKGELTYYIGPNGKKKSKTHQERAFFIIKQRNPVDNKQESQPREKKAVFETGGIVPKVDEEQDTQPEDEESVWQTPS